MNKPTNQPHQKTLKLATKSVKTLYDCMEALMNKHGGHRTHNIAATVDGRYALAVNCECGVQLGITAGEVEARVKRRGRKKQR